MLNNTYKKAVHNSAMKRSFSPEGLKGISFLVNEECMSMSLLSKIDSQCNNIDYYHKFIVTDTKRDCSHYYALETLLNFLDPIPISPVYCRFQPKECFFLANDCREAVMAIINNRFRIPNPKNPDNPFKISIVCNFCNAATIDNNKIGNLQNILQQRFNQETKTLNLSELFKDEDLVEYCPLSYPKVMLQVMSIGSKLSPVNINLQNNYLKDVNSIYPLNKLEVEFLDLSNNEISSLEDLEILKYFSNLKALNLDGNPICSNYDSYNYVLDIKSICKNLEILDNHRLLSLPKYRKTFVCQPEAKYFVSQFLEHFFTVYDSDNRANMALIYGKDAIFSVSSVVIPERGNSDPIDLSHYGSSQPFAVQGVDDILKVFEDFPKTHHDQFSFVCDVMLYEPTFVALSVRGILKENKQIMAFDRHFLIKRNDDEFLIINEQLMVQNVNKQLASWYFRFPTPGSYLPYSMEQYETLEMVTQQLTTTNRTFCNKLLDHCQYDLKKALDLFCNLYLHNEIPQEAFNPDNPSDQRSELHNGTVNANTVWRTLRGERLENLPEKAKPTKTCITKMFRTPFPVNRNPFSNYRVQKSGKVVKKLTNDGKQKTEFKQTGQLNGAALPTLTVPQSQRALQQTSLLQSPVAGFCDIQIIFRNLITKIVQDTTSIKLLPKETKLINELSDHIRAYFDAMKNNSACRREDIFVNTSELQNKNLCHPVICDIMLKICRGLVHVIIHEYVENSNCSNTDEYGKNHIGICWNSIYRDYNKEMLNNIILHLKEVETDLKPQIPKFERNLVKKRTDVAALDTAITEEEIASMEETAPVVKTLKNEPSKLTSNKPNVNTLQKASESTKIKAFCDIQIILRNIIEKIMHDTSGVKTQQLLPEETGLINELSDHIRAYFDAMKNNSACGREDFFVNIFKLKNSCPQDTTSKLYRICRSLVHVIIHEYVDNSNCSNPDTVGKNLIGICWDPVYRDNNKVMLNSIRLHLKEVEADLKPQILKVESNLVKKQTDVAALDVTVNKEKIIHNPYEKTFENEPSKLTSNKPNVGTLQKVSKSTKVKDIQIIFRNLIIKIFKDTRNIKLVPKEDGFLNELSNHIKAYFDAMKNNYSKCRKDKFTIKNFKFKERCQKGLDSLIFNTCRSLVHVIFHEYVENSNCSYNPKNMAICKDLVYRGDKKRVLDIIKLHLKDVEADLIPQIPKKQTDVAALDVAVNKEEIVHKPNENTLENEPSKLTSNRPNVGTLQKLSESTKVKDIQIIFRNVVARVFKETRGIKLMPVEPGILCKISDHIRAYFDAMRNNNSACRRDFIINKFEFRNCCQQDQLDKVFNTCRSLIHVIIHEYVENSNCSNTDNLGKNHIGICCDPIYRDDNKITLYSIRSNLKNVEADLKPQIPKKKQTDITAFYGAVSKEEIVHKPNERTLENDPTKLTSNKPNVGTLQKVSKSTKVKDIQTILRNLIAQVFQDTNDIRLLPQETSFLNELSNHIKAYFDAMKNNYFKYRKDRFILNKFNRIQNRRHQGLYAKVFSICRSLVHVIFHEYVENSNCCNTTDNLRNKRSGICGDPIYRDNNKKTTLYSIRLHLKDVESDLKPLLLEKRQTDVAAPKAEEHVTSTAHTYHLSHIGQYASCQSDNRNPSWSHLAGIVE